MSQNVVLILFEFVALIFALSVHEYAHAWMASRLGDHPGMLGRMTLNPIKHIDPLGSVILPLISAFYGFPLIGWAKPTPVTPRNFRNYKRDDVLVAVAGPASNLLFAIAALLALLVFRFLLPNGKLLIYATVATSMRIPLPISTAGLLFPLALLLYSLIVINLLLFVFNLFPIPPLDGARVLVHYLPPKAAETYQRMGGILNLLLFLILLNTGIFGILYSPLRNLFNRLLLG